MTGLTLWENFWKSNILKNSLRKSLSREYEHSVDLKKTANIIVDEILNSIKPFLGAKEK